MKLDRRHHALAAFIGCLLASLPAAAQTRRALASRAPVAARTPAPAPASAPAVPVARTAPQARPAPVTAPASHPEVNARARVPVLRVLGEVEASLQSTRYVHSTEIDEEEGRYEFDCSGMASWVLHRAAPRAEHEVMVQNGRGRPVARDFHDVMVSAPARASRQSAWQRVTRVGDLRPGDVIAWRRPSTVASLHTGHVGFVVAAPTRAEGGWRVRIADATSIPHEDDTRGVGRPHRSGFGYGTILVTVDPENDSPRAYGWFGSRTRIFFHTTISMGRPLR